MKRILSIDVFRGLTVMLMVFVNHAGLSTTYSWFDHAKWHGCTFADVVFPFFLFIVGASAVLAIANLKLKSVPDSQILIKVASRSVWIFLIGVLLNLYPMHWHDLRILGVLQRISICYFVVSVLYLYANIRIQLLFMVMTLIFYWYLLVALPLPDGTFNLSFDSNIVGYIDSLFLGSHHLLMPNFDPEGLLSTLPAIVTTMFGGLLGHWLLRNRVLTQNAFTLGGFGIAILLLGMFWGTLFPINKSLWTSSYVLYSAGLGLVVYAVCYWLVDVKGWKSWSRVFTILGTNAFFVYVFHVLLIKTEMIIYVQDATGKNINLKSFFIQYLANFIALKNASLVYAGLSTLLCILFVILWPRVKSIFALKRIQTSFFA